MRNQSINFENTPICTDQSVFISAGLYRTKDGTVINADINGSANIIRKAIPEAFEGMTDFAFFQNAETVGFRDLHPLKAKQM